MLPIELFDSYPTEAKERLLALRALILDVAEKSALGEVKESIKWGEASYTCQHGSPIRIDWKPKFPEQVSIYVNCQTTLIETFKEVYKNTFDYQGNRELILPLNQTLPTNELRGCIYMALHYHRLKKRPLLGA